MSGTSLDGLDLAWVSFERLNQEWSFAFHKSITFPHEPKIATQLARGSSLNENEIAQLDNHLGEFIGRSILKFLANEKVDIDFIASHGHTLFHQPDKGLTLQVGNGRHIHKITGLPVILNFREKDVSLGGQGAPLVPIGDRDLFADYDYCLNLGGIANISFQEGALRLAYDICPVNMALNELAKEAGFDYDDKGYLASRGQINEELIDALNNIPFLVQKHPKSLGYEDYQRFWQPLILNKNIAIADRLHTMVISAAEAIRTQVRNDKEVRVLVTGGGAFNDFLLAKLREDHHAVWEIPTNEMVAFKEALIFAYMGLLRFFGEENTLASVTGAKQNTSSGDMIGFGLC